MSILWVMVSIAGLSILVVLVGLALRVRAAGLEVKVLKARLESVNRDLNALCSGAVGVDRRMTGLEHQGRSLELRQETLENQSQKQDERPYGEAIQMIHKGATAAGLVEKLGLSLSEAELMVMLHGVRKAS